MDKIKDRLITVILILLIIGIIAGIAFFIYYINNDTVDDEEISSENKTLNTTNEMLDNTINLDTTSKEPDGTPYILENKGTSEISIDNEKVDMINISDFSLHTSAKLKEVGYKIELENDNKVISISSNDGKYNYKLLRLSDKNPERLTEEQLEELNTVRSTKAVDACAEQGLTINSKNYLEVYNAEYSKITQEIIDFYDKYNINRFTLFSGIESEVLNENLKLLGAENFVSGSSSYIEDDGSGYADTEDVSVDKKAKLKKVEISSGNGKEYSYQGAFLVYETCEEGINTISYDIYFDSYKTDRK